MENRTNWLKYQAYSGLAVSSFVGLHLVNHVFGLATKENTSDKHYQMMQLFRNYYQNPII